MATLEQYVTHATRFGTDCVYPTATTDCLSTREMVELKVAVARIAKEHREAKRPPSWSDDVPKVDDADVVALFDEDFTVTEIAAHTAWPTARVQAVVDKLLAQDARDESHVCDEACEVAKVPEAKKETSVHAGSASILGEKAPKEALPLTWKQVSARGRTPAAKAKAVATRARRTKQQDADIIRLRRTREMVPGGIARVLNVGETRVRRILKAEGLLR